MTKYEVMLQKLQKWQKIDYKVRAGRPYKLTEDPDFEFSREYG